MSKELLQIKNLYANAETKEILKGLNLTVNKGEVHVIMGPNGAGKSTMMKLLYGMENPQQQVLFLIVRNIKR